jgi:hypothetical protein
MAPEPVELHSSLLRLTAAYAGPSGLIVIAVAGMLANRRVHVVALIVLALGVGLGLVAALDYPRTTRFGPDGVARRSLLRVQRLPWSRIDALTRSADLWIAARQDVPGPTARPVPSPTRRRRPPGGLVAMRGRRRYLLVDQVESRTEYDRLRHGVEEWAPEVRILAEPPPPDIAPTTTYRRRR